MKRKLLGILLALVMCLPLVVPAFAEPAEEPAAPEETVTLPVETETPAPEEAESEGTTWSWAASDEADQAISDQLARLADEGELAVGEGDRCLDEEFDRLFLMLEQSRRMTLAENSTEDIPAFFDPVKGEVVYVECEVDRCLDEEFDRLFLMIEQCRQAMSAEESAEFSFSSTASTFMSPPAKDHDHEKKLYRQRYKYEIDDTQHQMIIYLDWICSDPTCGYVSIDALPQNPETHSWTKGNTTGNYDNQGSTHTVEYTYTCNVCGATKSATTEEEHSFNKTDFGDNYHLGLRHYVEWKGYCSQCKCALTKWESYSCPGNNNGVGCVIPINKVDPPVEAEDVTEPEDVPSATDRD